MKRFHIHLAVSDLDASVGFYSKLFGVPPTKRRRDYAKWMLDDPRINFAVSSRGHPPGVNHLGVQVDLPQELSALRARAAAASADRILSEGEAACCYAHSDKHWTVDPDGLAWEHFRALSEALTYGDDGFERDANADAANTVTCCG